MNIQSSTLFMFILDKKIQHALNKTDFSIYDQGIQSWKITDSSSLASHVIDQDTDIRDLFLNIHFAGG